MSALARLVDPAARIEVIGTGYGLAEGPVWNAREQALYFSDITGDTRWRWRQQTGMEVALRPTFKANGQALDLDGNLLVCEQVTSSLVRFYADGARELLAFHYGGRYLNSPNDLCVRALDGGIYFSDPDYGRWEDRLGQARSRDLTFRGLYRVPHAGGAVELLADEDTFDQPNGLCFSPDESLLYVNDSGRGEVKVFDVASDGSLGDPRLLRGGIGPNPAGEGNVDGMECDEHGNIWTSGPGGIWVLSPAGDTIGVLEVPAIVKSLCWGGADMHTLFVMTTYTAFAVRTIVGPTPLPPFALKA